MTERNLMMHFVKLFLVVIVLWSTNASANTIKLVTGDFAPFSGKDLSQGGMITEIIVKAFKEVGYATKIEYRPWKRGYQETLRHKHFGTFPYVTDDERKKLFLFSDAIYAAKVRFFVRSDFNRKYEKDEDLKGLRVCVPIGYSSVEIQRFLDKKILNTITPLGDKECFRLVEKGRTQLYSVNEVTGWTIIQKLYGTRDGFRTIGEPLRVNGYYIIVAETYPDGETLLEQFNKGLNALKQKGIYQQIIDRHLGNL